MCMFCMLSALLTGMLDWFMIVRLIVVVLQLCVIRVETIFWGLCLVEIVFFCIRFGRVA